MCNHTQIQAHVQPDPDKCLCAAIPQQRPLCRHDPEKATFAACHKQEQAASLSIQPAASIFGQYFLQKLDHNVDHIRLLKLKPAPLVWLVVAFHSTSASPSCCAPTWCLGLRIHHVSTFHHAHSFGWLLRCPAPHPPISSQLLLVHQCLSLVAPLSFG